ncbi:thiamine pyrophosphate-dependent enzyme [Shewanella sp. D64]|uniref:thiamine pyrophosphate-dependent enzyme n=1 Tax=unclassified Shewanella TaxID=196818 RepID=UPI0022BA1744|nr:MULTISPECIES: thiamine pyrophosphate-binding protein [unclassified Shewanella]MEC4725359.1 thiamine pyrophosphate-dependent enzyme [Shewanella sp. D64]MEC4735795.1 thiamine pyrophosphate-dependent enzyme [Shewanella sp. E94]WBJ93234.1 thiamine pyrophosphate-dependent enzyme [Shewanella sp. MTB7]
MAKSRVWYKVLENKDELLEGRVMSVTAGHQVLCLSHFEGKYSALDNRCPHQGGPLGEGSIEKGLLRCPWHGWEFHPCSGIPPGGFSDGIQTFEVKVEGDSILVAIEEEADHQPTISDVMVETMVNWGVNRVFGMVGHSNLGMADALRRQEEQGKLKFIGIRHEGAASFAASAYGKLTGKPAACFAIAGPGSTNMFTGLWDAKVDRAPILALTGQVATQVVGTGNFQEVDLVRAFDSVAEFNHRVEHRSKHSELMSLAIKTAIIKRDVAHLTFPDEVQELPLAHNERAQNDEERITSFTISPPLESVEKALNMLNQSSKPAIVVGHGARFHMKEIIEFAEKLNCPVMTTFKAKGQISDHHPLGCGVLGRSGTPIASWFMNEADLLLVIGASFSNHSGITPKKPTIQIDFDPMALSKFHKIDAAVWGEISVSVKILAAQMSNFDNKLDRTSDIKQRSDIWDAEKAKRLTEARGKGVSSISVFDALSKLTPDNAVVCVDVGNNAYSLGRYFESKQQTFLMSGYLGSIGFAFPAAMGAWAAVGNQRPIIAVAGDGGFCQYLAELTTAVKYKMPIKAIILNNSELGKISKEQRAGEFDVWATDLVNPNFSEYANSCGALGIRVIDDARLVEAMKTIMEHQGPALLEIITDVGLI